MVYNSTYQSEDFVPIATDLFAEFGVQLVAYVALIVIVVVIAFLVSKFRGR